MCNTYMWYARVTPFKTLFWISVTTFSLLPFSYARWIVTDFRMHRYIEWQMVAPIALKSWLISLSLSSLSPSVFLFFHSLALFRSLFIIFILFISKNTVYCITRNKIYFHIGHDSIAFSIPARSLWTIWERENNRVIFSADSFLMDFSVLDGDTVNFSIMETTNNNNCKMSTDNVIAASTRHSMARHTGKR